MLRNYLIIAWRNLWNNKVFSFINITGLAVAMAACLLIYVYISFEKSYDNFHENGDDIYRLVYSSIVEGVKRPPQSMVAPFAGEYMQSHFPEIISYARVNYEGLAEITRYVSMEDNETFHEDKVYYVDPTFLEMFSFQLLVGDKTTALNEPYTVVISESLAKKIYNWNPDDENALDILNKTLWHRYSKELSITGVAKDVPADSHFKFDALISMDTMIKAWWKDFNNNEVWNGPILYVMLKPGTNVPIFTKKVQELFERRHREHSVLNNSTFSLTFQPIRKIHLHSSDFALEIEPRGNFQTVRFLLILCLFILTIAWINYINLTTSRSLKRTKEVGIKKIVGAEKKQLIEQFLIESAIVNLISLLLALTLAQVCLPYFEQLVGKDLQVELLSREYLILISGFLVLGVIISGLYPALLLSSFKSISMLSGIKNRKSNKIVLRKYLVIMQFAVTFSMLIGTFTIYRQLAYMQNNKLGFNAEHMLVIEASGAESSRTIAKLYKDFKNKLKNQKGIVGITASTYIPGKSIPEMASFSFDPEDVENQLFFPVNSIDPDFFDVYGIGVKYGRNFYDIVEHDMESLIMMEQTAIDMGFEAPEDALTGNIYTQVENRRMNDTTGEKIIRPIVIGIVENYHQHSLKTKLQPMIFQKMNAIKKHRGYQYFSIRLAVTEGGYDQLSGMISLIEKKFKEAFPYGAFNYFFLDDLFNSQYQSDQKFGAIIGHFSILAILIACLGMFGLSLFTLQQRTKEIGIRKAHGASTPGLLLLLSKDFMKLIIISILLAIPIVFFPLRGWLQTFAYRIDLSWWLFAVPAVVIVLIALLTISIQSIKAALANPVKALRYE